MIKKVFKLSVMLNFCMFKKTGHKVLHITFAIFKAKLTQKN